MIESLYRGTPYKGKERVSPRSFLVISPTYPYEQEGGSFTTFLGDILAGFGDVKRVLPQEAIDTITSSAPPNVIVLEGWNEGSAELVQQLRQVAPEATLVLDELLTDTGKSVQILRNAFKAGCDNVITRHYYNANVVKTYQEAGII